MAITTWLPTGNVFRVFELMQQYMPPRTPPATPSPFDWGHRERVRDLFGSAFHLKFERGVSYYREPSPEAAWDTFVRGYGPAKALAAGLGPDRCEALRADFVAFHSGFPTPLGICVPREYWVTVGVRV